MGDQAGRFGITIPEARADHLDRVGSGFSVRLKGGQAVEACAVILATGIVDNHPDLAGWRDALAQGDLRYCPICDGYED